MPSRRRLIPVLAALAVMVGALGRIVSAGPATATTTTVGYRDFSYSPVSAPTGQKPESKLWFNDGLWWGVLFSSANGDHMIHRFDWANHRWTNTGTVVDNRNQSHSDTLWQNGKLYVVTAMHPGASTSDPSARLLRYSYDGTTDTYTLDAGYPVKVASQGVEAVVLDRDTTGSLWLTYTAPNGSSGRSVFVTHSTTDDATFAPAYVLPVPGASNLTTDDISALVAYRSKVGVLWSNQNDNAMYFASHDDGAPDSSWTSTIALQGPKQADDHINLKSLSADPSGDVFAAVKTSQTTPANAPLVVLLVLREGAWTSHTFGEVADDHTRAIVLLDGQHRRLYMFASAPCCSGGTIYMKESPLDNIAFPPGLGTAFIQSSTDPQINNPTSTKQTLNSDTGLLVLAGDDSTQYYLHNTITFPADEVNTTIESGPSGSVQEGSATFTFSANVATATFQCRLDGGSFTPCASPTSYSGLAEGTHSFEVAASDEAGNSDPSPATRTWIVDLTAPNVVSVTPADTATDVATTAVAEAAFSEPVDALTLTPSTFTLTAEGATSPVAAAVSYDGTSRTATLRPESGLVVGTAYQARVVGGTSGVKDVAGNPLGADKVWNFTTEGLDTQAPETVLVDSGPTGTVRSSSAIFNFSANEQGATFECQLDAAPFAACTSPASYSRLADGLHTFAVRAVDSAGNRDSTPATRSWIVDATIVSDGFESGNFSAGAWTIKTGGDGTARVQNSIVEAGTWAARLTATTNRGSQASARRSLSSAPTDVTFAADFRFVTEGKSGKAAPLFKTYEDSSYLVALERDNVTGDLQVVYGGVRHRTAGRIPLGQWTRAELRLVVAGGAGAVEVYLDGQRVYQATADIGSRGLESFLIGNSVTRQAFDVVVDDVTVRL